MKQDSFGINMKKYCREHEAAVKTALDRREVTEELLVEHRRKISMLQHERLIHLIVTVASVIVELFAVYLVLVHPELGIGAALFMLAFAVLLAFYFNYYFFLENTVQRWYKIEDELRRALAEKQAGTDRPDRS